MDHVRAWALLASCALFAGCGAGPKTPPHDVAWITTLDAASPLVGKAWDSHTHALVPRDLAARALDDAPLVLLGEKHDNPDHHRLQAEALQAMVAKGRHPAVVFEMIDQDLQASVDAYLARPDATVDGLGAVLEWDKRGWPAWSIYRPIFVVALAAHLKVVAGGLGHAVIHDVMKEGLAALPPDHVARLHLEPLPPALSAALEADIRASHCGALPDAMIAPMSLAQRVKDAMMAELLRAHAAQDGAVLIAGDGHVRTDRGVPEYLRRAGATSVTLSLLEVQKGESDPARYAAEQPSDFIVFTPRLDDEDPCAQFGKKTKKEK